MKRTAVTLLCACGRTAQQPEPTVMSTVSTERRTQDLLSDQHWYNIHNGDCYALNTDGSGNHNGISLTFTAEEDRISVMEGVAALQAKTFRLDRSGPYLRLIPDGEAFRSCCLMSCGRYPP